MHDPSPLPDREQFDHLRLSGVSFSYSTAEPSALTDVSFELARGDYVGIIGRSGAGKTTLLNLMLGLLTPAEGTIIVNSTPIQHCRRSWQHRIGFVPQDVAFLDSTISENVALGQAKPEIDRDRVMSALRDAQLDDVVASLRDGIDTQVQEAGARFSGGQRQRLGLARALYRQPEILILDEATSALDSTTEGAILSTLQELRSRITIVVVAHRPSTIATCDRVIRIEGGTIVMDPDLSVVNQAISSDTTPQAATRGTTS